MSVDTVQRARTLYIMKSEAMSKGVWVGVESATCVRIAYICVSHQIGLNGTRTCNAYNFPLYVCIYREYVSGVCFLEELVFLIANVDAVW